MKVRTDDDGKVTTQVTSERETVTVENSVWFGSMGAKKLDAEIATYKLNVDSVKRAQGNCAASVSAAR